MVQVDVFGIREETPAGACSCGGACASTAEKTMGYVWPFCFLVSTCNLGRILGENAEMIEWNDLGDCALRPKNRLFGRN